MEAQKKATHELINFLEGIYGRMELPPLDDDDTESEGTRTGRIRGNSEYLRGEIAAVVSNEKESTAWEPSVYVCGRLVTSPATTPPASPSEGQDAAATDASAAPANP